MVRCSVALLGLVMVVGAAACTAPLPAGGGGSAKGVQCGGPGGTSEPVVVISGSGVSTSVPCPGGHTTVVVPTSSVALECQYAGYVYSYQLAFDSGDPESGERYHVRCTNVGDVVPLAEQGGRFQIECPSSGVYRLFQQDFFGGETPADFTCTPGTIEPAGANAATLGSVIDWNTLSVAFDPYMLGKVQCPAAGALSLYFLGEGAPSGSIGDFGSFACTPGSQVDVTTLII